MVMSRENCGKLFHDCSGRKLNRGDQACFDGYDHERDEWRVVAIARKQTQEQGVGHHRNIYFSSKDPWIFLDNSHYGLVVILHPVHGMLDVPISSAAIVFILAASLKDNTNE